MVRLPCSTTQPLDCYKLRFCIANTIISNKDAFIIISALSCDPHTGANTIPKFVAMILK